MKWQKLTQHCTQIITLCLLALVGFPSLSRAQAPVFEITPLESSIKFHVKSSTTIAGKFDVNFHLKGKRIGGPPLAIKQ
jgi:hypothetical protein